MPPSWPPRLWCAELEQRLAGSPQQQGEKCAFVGEDEGVEVVRQGKDAVEIGHLKEVGLAVFKPLFPGEGLACGAVAIATRVVGIALEATLPALFSVSAKCSRATGHEVVHDLVVGWRHGVSRAVGVGHRGAGCRRLPTWVRGPVPCLLLGGSAWRAGPWPQSSTRGGRVSTRKRSKGLWMLARWVRATRR